jgi:RHS repeat-associated protein
LSGRYVDASLDSWSSYAVSASTNPFQIASHLTWNANGSLAQVTSTDTNDSTKNQNCSYTADDLGRIASVNCGSSTWAQSFSYDPFGNINKSGSITYSAAYNSATNQVSSGPPAGYDANGNQLSSTGLSSISWNANGQAVSVSSQSNGPYGGTYDALGRLVEVSLPGGGAQQFVYGPSGTKIAVVASGNLVKGTVPLPGGATAIYSGTSGMPYIRHTDWLGSSRLASTWNHGVYAKESYAPFGEVYNEAGTSDRSFTGQDQDVVSGAPATGIYEFMFRKYDPAAGRWLSPDPAGWDAVSPDTPQSLNRYAYTMNNPLSSVDLNGLYPIPCPSPTGTTLGGDSGAGGNGDVLVIDVCDNGIPVGAMPGCDPSSNGICGQIYSQLPDWAQTAINYVQSATDLVTGNFDYSGLAKSIKSCVGGVGLPTMASDLNPLAGSGEGLVGLVGVAQSLLDARSQSLAEATGAWSASRGLIVPLRSSVARAGMSTAETVGRYSGAVSIAMLYGSIAHAYYNEATQCN